MDDKLGCIRVEARIQLRSCFAILSLDWLDCGNKMEMEGWIQKYLKDTSLRMWQLTDVGYDDMGRVK